MARYCVKYKLVTDAQGRRVRRCASYEGSGGGMELEGLVTRCIEYQVGPSGKLRCARFSKSGRSILPSRSGVDLEEEHLKKLKSRYNERRARALSACRTVDRYVRRGAAPPEDLLQICNTYREEVAERKARAAANKKKKASAKKRPRKGGSRKSK